jgi:trigger factor
MSNTVKIEEVGPCRKKISIDVPAETVNEAMEAAYATVAHEATIPGFRKGRAPRRLVEKRFGSYVQDETRSRLCTSAYQEAVESNELKILAHPPAEYFEDVEVEAGNPVHIEVEVEVMPEFDLPDLKGIEVYKPDNALPDGMVDDEIKKIAINEGDLDEQDKSEKGNYLTGKAVMVDAEGTEHYNIDGAVIQLPEDGDEGMVLGVIVSDFTKQVGTPKEGDSVTIKVKGPENHEVEALRGKDLTVTFDVAKIYAIVPAPMADIVAKYGFASEDQLKEMVSNRLEQRAVAQQQSVMRQQVVKFLADSTEFELPAGLTAQQAARSLERQRMELMYRGVDPTEIEQNMAQLRNASAARATTELKQFFMINKAAEALEVQVEEAEINAQIVQMAMQQGKRPEQFRDELIKSGQAQALVQQVREHKTVDKILEDAKVEDISAEDFNKKFANAE